MRGYARSPIHNGRMADDDDAWWFGQAVKRLYTVRGEWTQSKLAKAAKVSPSTVRGLERGFDTRTAERKRILDAMKTTVEAVEKVASELKAEHERRKHEEAAQREKDQGIGAGEAAEGPALKPVALLMARQFQEAPPAKKRRVVELLMDDAEADVPSAATLAERIENLPSANRKVIELMVRSFEEAAAGRRNG